MTIPKLDSLSNEQIRVMCAEAMGWIHFSGALAFRPKETKHVFARTVEMPDFLGDANAALTLCAWMADRSSPIVLSFLSKKWVCVFYSSHEIDADELANRNADTLPFAICRAFLIANNLAE